MEVIYGILAAFLQFNFFSILFFAGICYVTYHGIFTSLMGTTPEFSLIPSKMLPPIGAGLDGIPVFGAYLFFMLFVLLMLYHLITYWHYWSIIGVIFLGIMAFQIISGMGGIASFLKFILSIVGILLALVVAFGVLFFGIILISVKRKDKKSMQKYEERLERERQLESLKNGSSA